MKKALIVFFILVNIVCFTQEVDANENYAAYEELALESGKLLVNYTKEEYDEYYNSYFSGGKFFGWTILYVNVEIPVKFRAETVFSLYNDGTTPITYEMTLDEKTKTKHSISATGSIAVNANGTVKNFKTGLDTSLKVNISAESSYEQSMSQTIKIQVDPGTQASMYVDGVGTITNGVAARYFCFMECEKGGYEIFTIGSQYYRLEKTRIR